jgi:hypothetical protein
MVEETEEVETTDENAEIREELAKAKSQLINMQVREELKDDVTYRLQTIIKHEQVISELKQVNDTLVKIGKNLNILCKTMDKKK